MSIDYIRSSIRTIPDYPKPGIQFRDVTSLLLDPKAFSASLELLAEYYQQHNFNKIVGAEARGFIFGAPLAHILGAGFVPVRKPNKLPGQVLSQSYDLEYGTDNLEIHHDAIEAGDRVLLIDDLLATGGTMEAATSLVRQLGGEVSHAGFVVSLPALGGDKRLEKIGITPYALCDFDGA